MTPEERILNSLDSIIADTSIPTRRRNAWSKVRTAAAKIVGAKVKVGRPKIDREKIRKLSAKGLSQAEIADEVGCSLPTVSRALRDD